MRIVAGRFGGRRLAAPPGRGTRPTAERVREALFSMLGPLDGAQVLDLFAGTGALGLEALSRGAARSVFVERDRRTADVLKANLATLAVPGDEAEVHVRDALAFVRDARDAPAKYDLVFLDPPYRRAPELGQELTEGLGGLLGGGARVVAESDRRTPLELGLTTTHERRYGDTLIRIHEA